VLVGGKALGGPLVGVCDVVGADGPAPEVGRGKAPIPVNDTGCRSVRSPSTGEGDRVENDIPSPCD
jgi:hypothetical protein